MNILELINNVPFDKTKYIAYKLSPADKKTIKDGRIEKPGLYCPNCQMSKPIYSFDKNGTVIDYKTCSSCSERIKRPDAGAALYYGAVKRSKKKGRGPTELTIDIINKMWVDQDNGKCAILDIQMNQKVGFRDPYSQSLERIRNQIGYTIANTVLICVFLQIGQTYQMTHPELRNMIMYDKTLESPVLTFDPNIFEKESRQEFSLILRKDRQYFPLDADSNIDTLQCTHCLQIKSYKEYNIYKKNDLMKMFGIPNNPDKRSELERILKEYVAYMGQKVNRSTKPQYLRFNRQAAYRGTCKECERIRRLEKVSIAYNHVQYLATKSKEHAGVRGVQRSYGDKSHLFETNDSDDAADDALTVFFIELIIKQKGRCALTGIMFNYTLSSIHAPSADRINESLGYVKGNVQIVCSPLNTRRRLPQKEYISLRKRLKLGKYKNIFKDKNINTVIKTDDIASSLRRSEFIKNKADNEEIIANDWEIDVMELLHVFDRP
jgi:hypothetical protein